MFRDLAHRHRTRSIVGLALALALVLILPAQARAQAGSFIDRVNAKSRDIPSAQRADMVLLPALAKMTDPPASVSVLEDGRPTRAMLIGPGTRGWDEASRWAAESPQQEAIAALDRITQEASFMTSMVMAQPYGINGVPVELVRAGMYTELGDPPLLAMAEFRYLPRMTDLAILAHIEATRRLNAGNPAGALDVLIDLLHLGRMMADREFFEEVSWGYRVMIDSAIRIRDVAFVDYSQASPALTHDQFLEAIGRLDLGRRGFVLVDRLRLPEGDYIAAQQILDRIFGARGEANERFATTMSALTTSDRPLRRFSDAGLWAQLRMVHADGLDSRRALDNVYNDWAQLWTQNDFAPAQKLVREYDRLNPVTHGVLKAVMPELTVFFNERRILRTEVVGTRASLGVLAYKARLRTLPVSLAALRPQILPDTMEVDPFGPIRDARNRPLASELKYLVPRRDLPPDPRLGHQPLPIDVIMLNQRNFGIRVGIDADEFVIWSVGPDSKDDTARRVRENTRALYDGDYLIWPPVISLYREFLQGQGEL